MILVFKADYREASESSDGHFSRNVSEGADDQFNE